MDQFQQFFAQIEPPPKIRPVVRRRIMKQVYSEKYRVLILLLLPLTATMMVFSGWQIWQDVVVTGAYAVLLDMLTTGFQPSLQFLNDFVQALQDIGTWYAFLAFIGSCVVLAGVIVLPRLAHIWNHLRGMRTSTLV